MEQKKVMQVKMFKEFVICVDKVCYDLSEYLSKQLLNLLQVLLINHDQEVSKQTLYEILWSKSENPRNVMKFTVFRLRNDLKRVPCFQDIEFIETGKNGYRVSQNFTYELDLEKFMNLYDKVACNDTFQANDVKIGKKMMDIYKGRVFMTNSCLPWVEELSEKYRIAFANTVIRMCRYYIENENFEEMIQINHKAIVKEPFYEGLHYYYMKGLIETKDYHKALQYYDEINEAFYHELGTGLSSKFEQLYEIIALDRKQQTGVSMEQLLCDLNQNAKQTGGFYCTFALFKHIYEVCFHSAQQEHKNYYILLFALHGSSDPDKQTRVVNQLKNIIADILQPSDIFTRMSLSQFALLINCAHEENTQLVAHRIISSFYEHFARNQYQLTYEVVAVNDIDIKNDVEIENNVEKV